MFIFKLTSLSWNLHKNSQCELWCLVPEHFNPVAFRVGAVLIRLRIYDLEVSEAWSASHTSLFFLHRSVFVAWSGCHQGKLMCA